MSSTPDRTLAGVPDTRDITLLELLDRLLDKGVVLRGDIRIAVADVDLIVLDLAVMLASAERAAHLLMPSAPGDVSPGQAHEPSA